MSNTFVDKSGAGIVLAAVNRSIMSSGYSFVRDNIAFGQVEESTNPERESQIELSVGTNNVLTGQGVRPLVITESQTIFVNRLDLTELFELNGIQVVQVQAGPETVAEVVTALNARYGLTFGAADIELEGDVAVEDTEVVLTANAASLGYKGQLLVQLVAVAAPLDSVVVNPVLGDLMFPVVLPEYLVAPAVTQGPVAEKGQTENGRLINGSGNPVGDLTVASNGELELALGARVWKSATTIPPVDGHYDLTIAESGDWNWPVCVTLLKEDIDVTGLYDITLTAEAVDTGESMVWYLVNVNGVPSYVSPIGRTIVDNAVASNGAVVQNIQRLTFYKEHLGAELNLNTGGSPIGNFKIKLSAQRREGIVEPLVCEITVNVTVA